LELRTQGDMQMMKIKQPARSWAAATFGDFGTLNTYCSSTVTSIQSKMVKRKWSQENDKISM